MNTNSKEIPSDDYNIYNKSSVKVVEVEFTLSNEETILLPQEIIKDEKPIDDGAA